VIIPPEFVRTVAVAGRMRSKVAYTVTVSYLLTDQKMKITPWYIYICPKMAYKKFLCFQHVKKHTV